MKCELRALWLSGKRPGDRSGLQGDVSVWTALMRKEMTGAWFTRWFCIITKRQAGTSTINSIPVSVTLGYVYSEQ
jgi:hypothetical protein